MESLIGLIIFIVIGVLSMVQKMKEQRDLKQRLEEEDREEDRTGKRPVYEETAHEETVRSAQPRGAQPRRTQVEMPQDMEDVIRQLMGQPAKSAPPRLADEPDDQEGDWQPVTPPRRREMPQQVQRPRQPAQQPQRRPVAQPARPGLQPTQIPKRPARPAQDVSTARQAQPRQRAEAVHSGELERREIEASRRQHQVPQPPVVRPVRRVEPTRRRRLLGNLHEVRRAIVLAEVIGPPRAFKDLDSQS